MLLYDITERESFENISYWMSKIKENAKSDINVILVGNKLDRESDRQVSREEGEAMARNYNISFLEVSAKNNINISEAYEAIALITKSRYIKILNI